MSEQNKQQEKQVLKDLEGVEDSNKQGKENQQKVNNGNVVLNEMINQQSGVGDKLKEELLDMGFQMKLVQEALKITSDKDKAIQYIIGSLENEEKLQKGNMMKEGNQDDSGFEDDDNEDYKIIFLVRMDLKMGLGKIAAQVAHATLKAYKQMEVKADKNEIDEVNFFEWLQNGQKKIVVKVNTENQLLSTLQKAKQRGLNCCSIRDAGLTQIASGSLTVGAIGPAPGAQIDALTKQFKLL